MSNSDEPMSNDDVRKMICRHLVANPLRTCIFPGTAGEAKARSDGQAEVGQMLAELINELNSFVGGTGKDGCEDHLTCNNCQDKSCEGYRVPKKVSGKMGIEEMIDYLRIRIKDLVFDLEATHRELQTYIDNDEFNC
jgi:hypothetical protein